MVKFGILLSRSPAGHYKIQEWNEEQQDFFDQPAWGLGMHVEISDPTDKMQMSRVTKLVSVHIAVIKHCTLSV